VDEVRPAGKGRIMTSDETIRELEQDLMDCYRVRGYPSPAKATG
jgi:hypothetical protein